MDPSVAAVLLLMAGGLLGGAFVWLVHAADARRQQARAALRPQLPDGIEHLLDALEAIVIVTDASHNVYRSSPGASSKGLVRAGRLDDRVGALVGESLRRGEAVTAELEIPRGPFGTAELTMRVRVAPIAARFFLVLAEDRTEAIRVEHVRRDFVANVSHELKTPIGAIMLLAEAIEEAAGDEEQVRYFTGRLAVEAVRLKRLTNELIDLSRLQATDTMRDATVVDLREVIELAIDQARVAAEAKRIRITVQVPPEVRVFGDPGLLLMGFHNLVANAVHYSPEGSPIGVGVRLKDGAVEVSVTDQGIGIAPENQERIFERFFRIDPARSRRTGGSGLGLSIVKHVVENHGGDIRVWSRLGKGSTFTVRLPLTDLESPDRGE